LVLSVGCFTLATSGRRISADPFEDRAWQSGRAESLDALESLLFALSPSAKLQRGHSVVPSIPRGSTLSMGLKVGDSFPAPALKKFGVAGKKAVVFFYGADDAPSCEKEISAFSAATDEFKKDGFTVVGVRNGAGVKPSTDAAVKLVVDEDDEIRKEIGIAKDLFGLLGGRETYVLDTSGTIVEVHNNQFDPESHVKVALAAMEKVPKAKPNPFEAFLENLSR